MKFKQILAIKFIQTKFKLLALISKHRAAEGIFQLFCTPFVKPEQNIPGTFSSAEAISVTVNGKKANGFCWNKGASHKIMILHGFSSTAYKFHHYINVFADKGYEVIAFNAPAHGNSEGKTVNVVEYKELIESVVEKIGLPAGFIAHSFGGIALALALEDIPHNNDTRVVLIAPATETTTAADKAFEMLGITNAVIRKEFDNIIFEKSGKSIEWFSIARAIKQIHAKLLWVHDKDDDITPLEDALKVKELNLPNVKFLITNGLGHRKIYRDNGVKKAVFDFLDFR